MANTTGEQFEFKAEVSKLLNIITHSLYTNREIFLRELISNASDALDKLRFEQSRGAEITAPELPLQISISIDEDAGTLTVADTGVGMTHDELMENLGSIGKSGSEDFLNKLSEAAAEAKAEGSADATSIIGRFGVGFYSVFMVADKVTVTTRSCQPGQHAYRWESDGAGTFTVEPVGDSEDAPERGARVTIHMREDARDFLNKFRLEQIIKTHSNFVAFDILLEGDKVNTTPALWREPKFEITPEQYSDFYKSQTMDTEDPLDVIHFSVDAPVQFTALAFIPKRSRDLYGLSQGDYGLDLYVRRVLITKDFKDLLPEYLGFLEGLVDTEDLPLNISRETLQENILVRKIATTVTRQTLSHLGTMAEKEPEKYADFWKEHGTVFKHGYADFGNREKFGPLLRFNSSHHEDKHGLTSLDGYIERMEEGQEAVYYIAGSSREAIALNPHTEMFRRKGLEVLYLYEPIDEFVLETLGAYKEKQLLAAEHVKPEDLDKFADVDEADKKSPELSDADRSTLDAMIGRVKEILGERVTDVRVSARLTSSPAVLVSPDGSISSHMQKIMRTLNKETDPPKKTLELNPDHPLLRNLLAVYKKDPQDAYLITAVEQLFESSLLMDGYLSDPHAMVERINSLLEKSSGWYLEVKGE
ncbi:molecular chaperone HtpG [Oceanidesulfovibrio indonesiensis]|uniref:Chaperone protein HtpG n=1 Tax=Oceanidesulfovibrio indonesiensis TaxID=54767 RepID=A0A7M3MHY2_9BACT|nr:molecular chaperone HtpG [Oceanidesulfovibrio indonesiensis]TVM18684.1 molecular chaperone HtpG [Oceanidesulfovibrio indonesiensis]